MNKLNGANVELLRSRNSMIGAGIDEKTLNLLVQKKVAEIMVERDAIVFEPFFRSRHVAYELKRLQTMPERRKWSVFFARYGCLICETRERIHVGNGMCNFCYNRTFSTLKSIIAEELGRKWTTPQETVRDGKLSPLLNRRLKQSRKSKTRYVQKPY